MRTPEEQVRYAASITPSPRQLAWQQLEFYAFTHFGMNTFTNREWGDGTEDPALFNPDALDADQWVAAVKSAGMKALILTCKHHDGFCLWPSAYTEHSVKNSPWKNGQGDVVREVSDACRRGGIKFGVYLSPWDRHDARYGQGKPYDDYFVSQLTELATNYGDIFCFWFDGACGEGKNGKKQIYDWERYYAVLRKLQPNAVLNVCGPDVRWCGNEAGHCRKAEWSVVPAELRDAERTASKSQQADDGEFSRKIDFQDEDIGSRAVIRNARELVWYPSEVDTSIRTGWFYHPEEDTDVRTADELLDIYLDAVGANASLLLNIHLINSGATALDGSGACVDAKGNHVMKPFWKMTDADIKACLNATDWCRADYEYFRGGGYSSHFRCKAEMPVTMLRFNIVEGIGPVLQIAEGWTADLPDEIHNTIDKRTDPTWPTTWFCPRLTGQGAFTDVYSVMANWGANHGVTVYGHVGADLITLASMLRIPVTMHNVPAEKVYRPHAWASFGTQDQQAADYAACKQYGPLYR